MTQQPMQIDFKKQRKKILCHGQTTLLPFDVGSTSVFFFQRIQYFFKGYV